MGGNGDNEGMSMREYTVVIEPGEDSDYVATCSSLNAVSQGATVDEALAAAGESIPVDRGAETHTV